MKDPVIYQVRGVEKVHTIPDKAVVTVRGENGTVSVWVDDEGYVHVNEDLNYEVN